MVFLNRHLPTVLSSWATLAFSQNLPLPVGRIEWSSAAVAGAALHHESPKLPSVGQWSRVPAMPTQRSVAATVELPDGRPLVLGGTDSSQKTVGNAEAFNVTSQTWEELPPMPTWRQNFGACVVGHLVFAVGGSVNSSTVPGTNVNESQGVDVLDLDSKPLQWGSGPPLPVKLTGVRAVAAADASGKMGVLTLGGFSGNETSFKFHKESYWLALGASKWVQAAPIPWGRSNMQAVSFPAAAATSIAPAPPPQEPLTAVLAFGGGGTYPSYATAAERAPNASSWRGVAALPNAVSYAGAAALRDAEGEDWVYSCGGMDAQFSPTDVCQRFHVATGTWDTTPAPLPVRRGGLGGCAIGQASSSLFVAGGSDAFIFTP